jgi:hypothetical protein
MKIGDQRLGWVNEIIDHEIIISHLPEYFAAIAHAMLNGEVHGIKTQGVSSEVFMEPTMVWKIIPGIAFKTFRYSIIRPISIGAYSGQATLETSNPDKEENWSRLLVSTNFKGESKYSAKNRIWGVGTMERLFPEYSDSDFNQNDVLLLAGIALQFEGENEGK